VQVPIQEITDDEDDDDDDVAMLEHARARQAPTHGKGTAVSAFVSQRLAFDAKNMPSEYCPVAQPQVHQHHMALSHQSPLPQAPHYCSQVRGLMLNCSSCTLLEDLHSAL